jgi:hypothetical protein
LWASGYYVGAAITTRIWIRSARVDLAIEEARELARKRSRE